MKKKTLNAQRSTFNIEWNRVREDEATYQTTMGNSGERKFDLEDRLLEFAVQIIDFTEALPSTRAANHIAGQLMRSGTSPYGNHGEVESAESRKDFVHKLKVCLKELRETRRWLRLAGRLQILPRPANLTECINEAEELTRIFVASIRTAERNDT